LKKLPVVEQYIICLDFDNINNEAELNATLASDTHFTTEVGRKKYYFNLTATESIKKLINEVPIRVLPGFGVVGSETFADLRYHDLAFYPLYSKYVNNNLITVHGGQYRGPFSIAQHDNYHALVASFFNSDDRKFACGTLPAFLGNNLFLSVDDLKPLLYGDGSFSDLDPGSYTELMYFLDIEPGEKRIIEYISAVSTVFIVRKLGDLRQLAEKSEDYQLEIDKHSHGFKTALALIKSLTDLSLLQDFPRKEMLNEVMKEIAIKIEEIPFIRDEDKKDILQYYRDQSHEQEVRVGCGNG